MKVCGKALQKEKKAIWKVSIVICVKIQRGYTGTFVDYMPSLCLHAVILFICLFLKLKMVVFLCGCPCQILHSTLNVLSPFFHTL